jgi:CrcB protein
MFLNILFVILGGSLGALSRFTIGTQMDKLFNTTFPIGILFVNLLGCFIIGLVMSAFQNKLMVNDNLKIFLIVGFLGSLTTFSTFAFDNLNLLTFKHFLYLFVNLFLTNFFGIVMVFLGIKTIKLI